MISAPQESFWQRQSYAVLVPWRLSLQVYIVYMGERHHGLRPELVQEAHHGMLAAVLGSEQAAMDAILYSYRHGFSGFAAVLTGGQAARLSDWPGVVRVVRNRVLDLHTTRSWDFMGVNPSPSGGGILLESRFGEDSIIGVLDTGIWPESASFRDDGIGEVPRRWKGQCVAGEKFNASNCNRKIIGAKWYVKGYEAEYGKMNTSDIYEFMSARDAVGHGTHTASTAAGALVANASFRGLAKGVARGGAQRARLAVYKVCWATGDCTAADILAAFDDAIHDGVDVISVSLGQAPPLPAYVDDVLSIGSFHAVAKGVVVVCSAGNSGPYSETVINSAPWIVTVAAGTIDRIFLAKIILGNNSTYVGQTLYSGKHPSKSVRIVYAEDISSDNADDTDARSCTAGSLNATLVKGNVVLCFQTRAQRSASVAVETVKKARGVGVIFAQFLTKDIASSLDIPCVQVDYQVGTAILAYTTSMRNPVAQFSFPKTIVGELVAPEVAYFSSRGPSSLSPSILKPDIAAPGVNILAAWSPAAAISSAIGSVNFKIDSGTSMSCPHISGVVALLKSMHPNWSPAAVKSALVTTANVHDAYGFEMVSEAAPYNDANPFDYGGGHVNPNRAAHPGLVYDMGVSDYMRFLCSMGYNTSAISSMTQQQTTCQHTPKSQLNLNVPSITIPELRGKLTVSRTVTNVGPALSKYRARVEAPPGVDVTVSPSLLTFNSTVRKLPFKVTFQAKLKVKGRYTFGSLTWEDGTHTVRIPLVVRIIISKFYVNA
ncbi:subtilisin-like protease SBT3.6 isoform X4 [Oryza sativa Japonica Group]|uniref:subtilisin-like protease SBT3.6 isoform X4 n=1 Tax=Oryza sativa subsp. japonica TaxID=39947 RepID=UPI00339CF0EF